MGSRLNCFDEAENLKEISGIFDWHPIKRPPFPLKGRPNSLVTSYPNPGWGNRILLRERPAHQCRNGSDLSILFASDAPTDPSRFRGPCHLPLLALGEVSAFRLLGHDVQGVWLVSCGAPTNGAEECRLIRRTAVSSQTSKPTDGWKLLEQGPKSQATSKTCSVGPSSFIDASDLVPM